jgi:hypothetical protein
MGELGAGLASYPGRLLVGFGFRVDFLASSSSAMLTRQRRRHDFGWALGRLDREPPIAHRTGRVGAVSLLEVWAHHEDARSRADLPPRERPPRLAVVVPILVRYQRRTLERHHIGVETAGHTAFRPSAGVEARVAGAEFDICRWLAGRGGLDALEVAGDRDATARLEAVRLAI